MNSNNTSRGFQGFLFSYELTAKDIKLRLLRLIPLARIRLDNIKYMRLSARREYLDFAGIRYWPSFLSNRRGQNPLYVIATRNGRKKYFLRLGGAFHYKVRSAIGEHHHD